MLLMKKLITICFCFCSLITASAQQKTVQERLGYPKDTRLLIIHADDVGVSQSENAATFFAMEKGSVSSASIMMPCPWMGDVAEYARTHPNLDFGLHLTLTSEWKNYKWGTVTPVNQAPSLLNKNGYLYSSVDSLYKFGRVEEVEKELKAQIERAKQFGIDPTHLDSHMGSLFASPEYLQILLKMGREYNVPVLLNKEGFKQAYNIDLDKYTTDKDVLVDKILMAAPKDFDSGMDKFYTSVLKSLQPGLSCILLHAAYDNAEMRAITVEHPDYGAAWRQADFDFFTSKKCRDLLKKQNIKVITWREIRDKLYRN